TSCNEKKKEETHDILYSEVSFDGTTYENYVLISDDATTQKVYNIDFKCSFKNGEGQTVTKDAEVK
ncbi:MAG: hypothetical protein HUJ63_03675, partial [Enterococcus sp.]|nr:hypothetical protein [Enterococcus sp.]